MLMAHMCTYKRRKNTMSEKQHSSHRYNNQSLRHTFRHYASFFAFSACFAARLALKAAVPDSVLIQ
jgi:hypothetical protein